MGFLFDLLADLFGFAVIDAIQEKWGWMGCVLTLLAVLCLIGFAAIFVIAM